MKKNLNYIIQENNYIRVINFCVYFLLTSHLLIRNNLKINSLCNCIENSELFQKCY